MLCRAVLIKLKSDNGLFTTEPGVPLGKVYWVYPESIQRGEFRHEPTGQHHHAQIIYLEDGTWMPLELLTVTKEIKGELEVLQ